MPQSAIDYYALLESARALGALPRIVSRLAEVVATPGHSIQDIAEVVSCDDSLTAALIKRANSAALGAHGRVRTLQSAAVLLGSSSLLSVALSTTISPRWHQPLPAYGLTRGALWEQSVAASLAAEVISAGSPLDIPAEAPAAALLHDFGKVLLGQRLGPDVLEEDGLELLDAESRICGLNHADAGGLVAQQWQLPPTIVKAIIDHHNTTGHRGPVSAVVSLAHAMVPEILAGSESPKDDRATELPSPRPTVAQTHRDVLHDLGFAPSKYRELITAAQRRYQRHAERYAA